MRLKNWIKNCKENLLDLVYPKTCFGCKKRLPPSVEGYICSECLQKIDRPKPPFCVKCGKSIDILDIDLPSTCAQVAGSCAECTGYNYHFTRGYTSCLYEGLVKDCIHNFKYNSHTYLGKTLAFLMINFAFEHINLSKIDAIVPVPLYWKKRRDRGFNQSEILGKILGKKTGIPFIRNGLSRAMAIRPQIELPRRERINNVKGAFKVIEPGKFSGKHLLLIDDVFTTGATLNECSKILLDSGAKDVWVFTLARGISP